FDDFEFSFFDFLFLLTFEKNFFGASGPRRAIWRTLPAHSDLSPDYAPPAAFLHARPSCLLHAHDLDPSGLDRCASTRCATRVGLICRDRRHIGAHGPAAQGPDGIRPSATVRNSAPSGQLVGS